MPIRPEHRWFYPVDWKQLSAVIRFERAKGRCEQCGRPHCQQVFHLGDGRWWDEDRGTWRDGQGKVLRGLPPYGVPVLYDQARVTRVVLAAAHLDHDPTNNGPRNLKAFCQRCHMLHDAKEHRRQRWLTFRRRKAIGDLFNGLYTPH